MASTDGPRKPLPSQESQAPPARDKWPKKKPKGGPQPARHIPWPEIFRHHISLVEGHLKMVDMVRKHTVEGSPNYRTTSDLLNRSKEMLSQAKNISKTFIPPTDQIFQVPLGSSSDSMYPGYSPANHKYGDAAQAYGNYTAKAKNSNEVGQSKGSARMKMAQPQVQPAPNGEASETKAANGDEPPAEDNEPVFFMDSKPTPITLDSSLKRKTSLNEPNEANASKKMKKKHNGAAPPADNKTNDTAINTTTNEEKREDSHSHSHPKDTAAAAEEASAPTQPIQLEYEDISQEVNARLRAMEEKRKRKALEREERKRKRESGDSAVVIEGSTEKLSRKKKKKEKDSKKAGGDGDGVPAADVVADVERKGADGDRKEKKKRKSQVSGDVLQEGKEQEGVGDEDVGKHKKKKVKVSEAETKEGKRAANEDVAVEVDGAVKKKKRKTRKEG
ncbi:MAG: hypothetical protein Q9222_003034 [Ikaeria aurantiellina]